MPRLGIGIGIPFGRRGGIDSQAKAAFDSLIAAGFTCPQGLNGINAAFKTIKTIYSTSDITTAISFFGDPALAYEIGLGSGTTLGQAIRTLPNLVDATRATDAVQTTAASQPLLLLHSGENYYQGVGVAGNFVSTPNTTANDVISEDLELIVEAEFSNYTNQSGLIGKFGSSGNANYYFFTVNKILYLIVRTGGSLVTVNSAIITALTENQKYFLRVTRTNAGFVQFSYSENGIAYTIVTSISSTAGNLDASSIALTVGARTSTTDSAFCKIFSAKMIKNGNLIALFNPNQYNAANSQTQWTSSSGEIWTINKSSGNTFVGVLVDRNIIQGNNSTTSMVVSSLASNQPYTEYLVSTRNGTGNFTAKATGNSNSHSGTNIVMNNGTALNSANTSVIRQQITFRANSTNSGVAVNNGTETTGNAGANNGTNLTIAQGAHNINTLVISKTDDTSPQRLAMYNYLREINLY